MTSRQPGARVASVEEADAAVAYPTGGVGEGPTNLLEAGTLALSEARWEDARVLLRQAVAAEESPAALEALTAAVWWLNDDAAVFALRERTFRLYTERGERGAAARTAAWLAWDTLTMLGDSGVASGWLQRAQRLVEGHDPDADSGWVAAHGAGMAFMRADLELARRRGAEAAAIGRAHHVPDLEMLGLSLEGMGLVAEGDVAAGLRRLDEGGAIALAGDARVLSSIGRTCCYVIDACEQAHDYERAEQWCRHGLEFAQRYDVPHLFGRCRGHYAEVLIWRGQWDEAETWLATSIEECERTRPPLAVASYVRLAELRRRQGRLTEAEEIVGRAGSAPAAILCRARLALDAGDAASASELADRYLRRTASGLRLARAAGLELLLRAALATGDPDRAAAAGAELDRSAEAVATLPLRALAQLGRGRVLLARGEHRQALHAFEDAVDHFDDSGASYETAAARLELAVALDAVGRPDRARHEADAARVRLTQLGAVPDAARAEALLERLDGRPTGDRRVTGSVPGLSPRESEVIDLIAEGLTNRQIAERLIISEHTVHRHVTNVLGKLAVGTRAAAVARAVELRAPPG